ncbi:hypothetical protein ACFQZZ_14525 [Nocardia sp. GCM10030253]|uniref:hypothetical protein n=1 Tax=Nocardia sp. GCM10030253 TaxID=3273404 RepID=UPI00363B8321
MADALNPATALYQILDRVINSQATSVAKGWESVLGADVGTGGFALRHSEVVGLLSAVHQRLLGLPVGDGDRERHLRYLPAWYDAIVCRNGWNSSTFPAANLIPSETLDHLGSLGSLFRMMAAEDGTRVEPSALDQLRESLDQWRELISEAGMPESLAAQIRNQVEHLAWLLDNIDMFGAAPVTTGANQLLGSGITVMRRRPNLVRRAAVAMASVIAFLHGTEDAVNTTSGILEGLVHIHDNVDQLIHGPRELPAPEAPRELSVGNEQRTHPTDIEDAEIVEEGAPSPVE